MVDRDERAPVCWPCRRFAGPIRVCLCC